MNFKRLPSNKNWLQWSSFILLLLCVSIVQAQKPVPTHELEFSNVKGEKKVSIQQEDGRIDINTQIPISLYNLNYAVPNGTPEEMASYFLQEYSSTLKLRHADLSDLELHAIRSTNAGTVVRYRQHYEGYPVNKAELTVSIDPRNKVQFLMNSYETDVRLNSLHMSISEEEAIQKAMEYINPTRLMMPETSRTMVYHNAQGSRLAHEITILAGEPQGEWHVFIDAQTQEIFKVENQLYYYCKHNDHQHDHNHPPSASCTASSKPAVTMANGTGFIFDPDPLSSNMVAYGGNYVDNNDATNTDLDNSRFSVTLLDIEDNNGTFTLRGPWAEIVDSDAPNTGLFSQNSSVFEFDREEQGFEPVNCYYHIDYLMRYINNTLGCNVVPYQYTTGVRFDPHGANGADNSFYSSGSGTVTFGEGCVDDAEDSDVIHHELGHGLHDWVTAGGLSQTDGLSEGCGDYVAQSYNRGLGNWTSSDPAYNWVFNWDGHNECWNGRVTSHNVGYPGGLSGQIHTDGQIWASCLMDIWDVIGQQQMDKIFYEGLGMTNGSSSQNDAANAVFQAAQNLNYTSAEIFAIHSGLTSCGYTLPDLPTGPDDAGIELIVSPDGTNCNGTITPVVRLKNYGNNDLTSVDIIYDIDGGSPMTFSWTGLLASTASTDITLPSQSVASGAHTFNATVSNPNGNSDTNNLNDAKTNNFDIVVGGQGVTLTLLTDDYGNETTWTLVDDNGTTIDSGGPYADNITVTVTWCLDVGCYDFTIFDSIGDGICCGYGIGSYTLTNDTEGTTIFTGGEFGSEELTNFCIVPSSCPTDLPLTGGMVSDTYSASNSVTSDAIVPAGEVVIYQAGNFIDLNEGFEVEANAEFLGEIVPCSTLDVETEEEENK